MDEKPVMTFRDRVYKIAKKIPKGKVATYRQIAGLAGNPKAARAVGVFMKTNPYAPAVPCHRVVGPDGNLTGYSGGNGILTKKKMLIEEGISFIHGKVDLLHSGWKC